jgi:hypothetical protein
MTLSEIRERAIVPALALLPARMTSPEAEIMLLSITQQEDPDQRRRQWPTGPARGLWQFERAGGVRGVLRHEKTAELAAAVCVARGVMPGEHEVHAALEHDDVLAAAFARLLLWTDRLALPAQHDAAGGRDLYLRVWRPGKPHPERWAPRFAAAVREVCR